MWRTLPFFLLLLLSPTSWAQDQDQGFECHTCQQDCEAQGLIQGERICTIIGSSQGDESSPTESDQESSLATATSPFQSALVHWRFIPVIETIDAQGAVSSLDVQRTVAADEEAINECFIPLTYPGDGSLDVEVHLAYNGIPMAVNGTPMGIAPDQARCILRRAWGYDFPRLAEEADKPARIHYRVSFIPQRMGLPETSPDHPQLLLERVSTPQTHLQDVLANQLYEQLPTVETCAAQNLRQIPHDLIVTEVQMQWYRTGDVFMPSDVDITVTNQTGTRRPSPATLDCIKDALITWDLTIPDAAPELHTIQSTFFITTHPAGWYGS